MVQETSTAHMSRLRTDSCCLLVLSNDVGMYFLEDGGSSSSASSDLTESVAAFSILRLLALILPALVDSEGNTPKSYARKTCSATIPFNLQAVFNNKPWDHDHSNLGNRKIPPSSPGAAVYVDKWTHLWTHPANIDVMQRGAVPTLQTSVQLCHAQAGKAVSMKMQPRSANHNILYNANCHCIIQACQSSMGNSGTCSAYLLHAM